VSKEEEEFEEVKWEEIKQKLWEEGFEIALVGAGAELVNKLLPKRCRLVYHDGLWWLKLKGAKERVKDHRRE